MRDHYEQDNWRSKESKYNDPPNSRLFIVCGKSITEEDFRECFSKFGTVSEIWLVRDRLSGEPKGVVYIKFSKTSEAALAMEEMNGQCIGNHPRPLKVLIAHSREQGSRRDQNENERLLRLFVVVPKTMTESELRDCFSQYGDIDYVNILRDRATKDSKGFGYVKYHRMSHAARAFENCDRSFKAVFADPKPQAGQNSSRATDCNMSSTSVASSGYDYMSAGRIASPPPAIPPVTLDSLSMAAGGGMGYEGGRLSVHVSSVVNRDQIFRLFDLVPGCEFVDMRRVDRNSPQNHAVVQYNNSQSAVYARDKLNGFEYPPGQRISVKFDRLQQMRSTVAPSGGRSLRPGGLQNDLAHLAETIAQATSLIQAAGIAPRSVTSSAGELSTDSDHGGGIVGQMYDPSYCSIALPAPQPLVSLDHPVACRLFIVCQPSPPPIYALKDVFARFGNLIDIYLLPGKSSGYAKYSVSDSANKAIKVLHGQEVCGMRLKVMFAEPLDKMADSSRKRLKMDEQKPAATDMC